MKKKYLDKKDIQLLKRAFQYVKPVKLRLVLTFILIVSGIVFGLVQPLLWAKILTSIFSQNYGDLVLLLACLTAFFILETLIGFLQNYNSAYLNECIVFNVKKDMYRRIIDLPVKAFDEMRVGDFMSRLHGDAGSIAGIITGQLLNTIVDVIRVVVLGITVVCISLPLSGIVLATFPISLTLFLKYGRIMREKNNELSLINDNYMSDVQQTLAGIREVKGLGIKNNKNNLFLSITGLIKEKKIKISVLGGMAQAFTQGTNFISQIAVMAVGVFLVFIKLLTIEYFIAFTSYSDQLSGSLLNLVGMNANLQQVMTSLERIFGIMDSLNYGCEEFGDKTLKRARGSIKFDGVVFSYDGKKQVLNGISFEVRENTKVAIVGKSGSGKSTIFNLLQRFYNPCLGRITVCGAGIEELSEEALRSLVSVVSQDPFLFNISFKDNLLLANPGATDEQIGAACRDAYIHDYIAALPDGYDTKIEENGANLSGGQKQRIAIARALLKNTRIVLFDEATSSLDNESQYNIKRAIDHLSFNHTVIIIAHRLLSIIEADEILVLDEGVIVGHGSHTTLINNNPIYKKLYKGEVDIVTKKQNEAVIEYV